MTAYSDVLKRHKPKGWRVYHSVARTQSALEVKALYERGDDPETLTTLAIAYPEKKIIRGPHAVCEFTLHIVLHEFAHVKLEHWGIGASTLSKEEYEADRLAMEWMRLEGIPVTRVIRKSSRKYIRHCLKIDEAAGVAVPSHIRRKH